MREMKMLRKTMGKPTILMVSAVLLLNVEFSLEVWRYRNIMDDELLFITKASILLEYEGSSFTEWSYPEFCEVDNKNSPKAVLTCRIAGYHKVKPLVSENAFEEEERHLHIGDSFFCFSCSEKATQMQILRVWVMDPENADPAEINQTALSPSVQSSFISKQFFTLGQDPIIKWSPTKSVQGDFNFVKGYWEIHLTDNEVQSLPNFWIEGKAVGYQNCFIASGYHTFHDVEPLLPPGGREVPLRLPRGSQLSVAWESCSLSTALLLSDFGTFITHDAFGTLAEILVAPHLLAAPAEGHFTLTDAVIVEGSILFLMDGSVYWRSYDRLLRKREEDLPSSGVRGLQYRPTCWQSYPLRDIELSIIAVWTEDQLYLGKSTFYKKADRALLAQILRLPSSCNVTIPAVAFGSRPPEVGVLVEACGAHDSSDARLFLVLYDEEAGSWFQSAFLAKLKPGSLSQGPFRLRFVQSALPSVLLWNKEALYYSSRNNSEYGLLRTPRSANLTAESGGSSIHQVMLDLSWNVVVKMENNALYFCKVGMDELVRLHMWERPGTNMALYLGPKGQMKVLRQVESAIEVHRYPLSMEVKSAVLGTAHTCTYFTFQHSMDIPAYYLDMGEQMELWAQIVYPENMGVNIQISGHRLDLLHVATRTRFEIASQVCTKNTTIKLYHWRDYSKSENYREEVSQTSGIVTLEVVPNLPGNTCNLPSNRISHIKVGCPPKRHIRISRPWGTLCEKLDLKNYSIPGSVLSNPQDQDLVVDYDWEYLGCLFRIYYATPFLPGIDLYDGDTFLKSVEANFIVWEENGRTDYSFNASMETVGCLREAQTWSSMLAGNGSFSSSTPGEAWGPHNYRSCFEVTPGVLGELSQPYEILNRSGNNFITWSQVQSGIYVFSVKILDPNFSFCDLQAVFAVQTYGVVTSNFGVFTGTTAMMVTLIVTGVLICTYFRYIKVFREMLNNPVVDKQ
nr:PREDICTED: uncharacterized protein C1orf101 homolog isoform X2 [Lepisosteus oculatus]